jgi:hypothetical protein
MYLMPDKINQFLEQIEYDIESKTKQLEEEKNLCGA